MKISVVRDAISRDELTEIAKQQFGEMVKAVVDIEQGIMAIGGELSQTKRRCFSRMLKKSASGVLTLLRSSTYRSVRLRLFACCGLAGRPF